MEDHLGDLYFCMDTQVNSTMMGFCQNRSRRYGLLCLKSAVCPRFSSLQNVMRLFHRDRDPDVGFLFSRGLGAGWKGYRIILGVKARYRGMKKVLLARENQAWHHRFLPASYSSAIHGYPHHIVSKLGFTVCKLVLIWSGPEFGWGYDMVMIAPETELHAELDWARQRPKSMVPLPRNFTFVHIPATKMSKALTYW